MTPDEKATFDLYSQLAERRNAALHRLLDTLIALAAGSTSITVAFQDRLTGGNLGQVWMLKTAWVCFALAILLGLHARRAEIITLQKLLERLQFDRKVAAAAPHWTYAAAAHAAMIAFALAVCALAAFGISL